MHTESPEGWGSAHLRGMGPGIARLIAPDSQARHGGKRQPRSLQRTCGSGRPVAIRFGGGPVGRVRFNVRAGPALTKWASG